MRFNQRREDLPEIFPGQRIGGTLQPLRTHRRIGFLLGTLRHQVRQTFTTLFENRPHLLSVLLNSIAETA